MRICEIGCGAFGCNRCDEASLSSSDKFELSRDRFFDLHNARNVICCYV